MRSMAVIVVLAFALTPHLALGDHADVIPEPIPQSGISIRLEPIVRGFESPIGGTYAPGLMHVLFITDQIGQIVAIDLTTNTPAVFLDVSSQLSPLGLFGPGTFDERGLLGLAFHPDYATNGMLYTHTSEPVGHPADFPIMPEGYTANHQSVITEWTVANPADPASTPDAPRVLMRIDQPQFNHNAGALAFGPDGMLYIALGDGGGLDDQDGQEFLLGDGSRGRAPIIGHGLIGNGQNTSNVLGAILRIDPAGRNAANRQYSIPADNPFFPSGDGPVGGQAGCEDGVCDEIFAYGFRNPFRMSIDMPTGLVFTGDVGQNDIEEVSIAVAGGNYGWKVKEGSFYFEPNGHGSGFTGAKLPGSPPNMIDPVAEYDHGLDNDDGTVTNGEGVSVIGGFVYRGSRIAALANRYVFGEFTLPPFFASAAMCNGRLFELDLDIMEEDAARIMAAVQNNRLRPGFNELRLTGQTTLAGLCLLGLAQDASGELYALTNMTASTSGATGAVLKIVPPQP